MNVSLTPELERWVEQRVQSGSYASASEVVRAGLRLLLERETSLADLRRLLAEADEDVRAGRVVRYDSREAALADVRRVAASRAKPG